MGDQKGAVRFGGGLEAVEHAGVVNEEGLPSVEPNRVDGQRLQAMDKGVEGLVGAFAPQPREEEEPIPHADSAGYIYIPQRREMLGVSMQRWPNAEGRLTQPFLDVLSQAEGGDPSWPQQDDSPSGLRGYAVP